MRLSKIKMAGFKSFVDPTTINFPAELTAIVGPNGCGKSNTIDAVRWVMGESSAKNLRGDAMSDVIFNGSTARKPVSQASVELVFDNSDGSLGGEYASYTDISIRRQVGREGGSKYFLNGGRCRRRDIADIFLGTGLGPRSYAIIEQGMISRVVDAKPQDLRVYIEEAAGISKYKERRRETENRIRHTRDNLDRLNDLREEIEKSINKLQRQSKAAERYTDLKNEERRAKSEVLALKLRTLSAELAEREAALQSEQTAVERQIAVVRTNESETEQLRQARNAKADEMSKVQEGFYNIGSQITALEQAIKHQQELRERQQTERQENQRLMGETRQHIDQDQEKLDAARQEMQKMQPALENASRQKQTADAALGDIESKTKVWQQQWDEHTEKHAESTRSTEVEVATIAQLERQIASLGERERRLHLEQKEINQSEISSEIDMFSDEVKNVQENVLLSQVRLDQISSSIVGKRKENSELRSKRDALQIDAHKVRAEIAAIDALQQAALGKGKEATQNWLGQRGLKNASRLGESIESESKWSRAVEVVLGGYIEAVHVEALQPHFEALRTLDKGDVTLFEGAPANDTFPNAAKTLWSVVKAPTSIQSMLSSVWLAESFDEALRLRMNLRDNQTVITPDGMWFGRGWVRASRQVDERAGVLNRQQKRDGLEIRLKALDQQVEQLQGDYEQRRTEVHMLEQQRNEQQQDVSSVHQLYAEKNALLSNRKSKHEQIEGRQTNLVKEIQELQEQLGREGRELEAASKRRDEALLAVEQLANDRGVLEQRREQVHAELARCRKTSAAAHDAQHEVQLSREKWLNVQENMSASLQRLRAQLETQLNKEKTLGEALTHSGEPDQEKNLQLEDLVKQRLVKEKELEQVKSEVEAVDHKIKAKENEKQEADQVLQRKRDVLEKVKISQQENRTRQQTLLEQIEATDFTAEQLAEELPEQANIGEWEEKAEKLARRISRLGPINLAAIDEFKEQSERKEYLDSQHLDLITALETLEKAIAKMDRETKTRFQDTFNQVNSRLGQVFAKLFGGGTAHLEMTEDDLLTTGITIMARPPGKKISNIHLLSGGEKAMTAVAMVFSIFELNPAPFCMLDEVDAPLDEANVGRFSEVVREMSATVQFIVITHNKTTMEMTDSLMGVTMREPGVSRLVDVNVDEAVMLATA